MSSLKRLLLMIVAMAIANCSHAIELPASNNQSKAWQPEGDLAMLLKKMEASCEASQKVFEPLTREQMNWRPPNETHTPRWNAEHMMGRQLLFFSQIFTEIDPEKHHVIDLNPAQMPPEYNPRHADWTGAQEAEQMQQVSSYIRDYAYLLEGLDLDAKAPGSRWKLRDLLKQMDRHFREHTANVEKKLTLPEWPSE